MTLRTLLLVVALLLATAAPASAHVRLLASDPEPGQALDEPPASIRLTFDEQLKAAPTITVTDPNGTQWSMGKPTMDGKAVTVPADAPYGPKGKYTINYRVTGQDGHLVTGDLVFDITRSFGQPVATQEEQPLVAAQQDDGDNLSDVDAGFGVMWFFVIGGSIVLVLLAGAVVAGARRRR
ncbi:copper resistance CopC family protein [Kibdelosporangium phytohabitans]|uniref:CopC domain-containing protein n=1 Tax=Kibdelosporangium phytohabitans TaxID=860235 RepID=A0A0N9HR64_9PSEU|nr:copper resistance CopC family protein [Kibdelosporangium phytohabitans]ALG07338.1 hypothetical protein AOZ06_10745 [Kibdelosporangium phytohabitans]MBE1471794.1 methionine-rich copper-binding protein CopC [Kibdelosporangium phytohabitans]